jgi:hypothetical protein
MIHKVKEKMSIHLKIESITIDKMRKMTNN